MNQQDFEGIENRKLFPKYYQEKMKVIHDLDSLENECRNFFGCF